MRTFRSRGFTLIELLVVIAIIGLLSAVILTSLNVARNRGNDAARESNLVSVEQALQLYYNDNGKYPSANGNYGTYASQCRVGGYAPQNSVITGLVSGGYISQLPTDPQMDATNADGGNCCYEYNVDATGANYKYFFFKGTGTPACSTSAAGTGPLADPARPGNAWAVYTPGGAMTL